MSSLDPSDVKNHLSTQDSNGRPVLLPKKPGTHRPLTTDSGIASPEPPNAETCLQPASAEAVAAPIEGETKLKPFLVPAMPKSSRA